MKVQSLFKERVRAFERDLILQALENAAGDVTKVSQCLGLDRAYLVKKIRSLNIKNGPINQKESL